MDSVWLLCRPTTALGRRWADDPKSQYTPRALANGLYKVENSDWLAEELYSANSCDDEDVHGEKADGAKVGRVSAVKIRHRPASKFDGAACCVFSAISLREYCRGVEKLEGATTCSGQFVMGAD